MTRRQRLEAVINGNITPELIEECKEELKKLDVASAKANERAKTSKNYLENKEVEQDILGILGEEPLRVEEISEALGLEMTRQRLTAICTNLVKEGLVESVDVKVKGKGLRKAYKKLNV